MYIVNNYLYNEAIKDFIDFVPSVIRCVASEIFRTIKKKNEKSSHKNKTNTDELWKVWKLCVGTKTRVSNIISYTALPVVAVCSFYGCVCQRSDYILLPSKTGVSFSKLSS